jgi:iron complex transport system substrate-binding protein
MRKILIALIMCIVFFSGCTGGNLNSTSNSSKQLHSITDMAGRSVKIPKEINKVYSTGQPGVVMLYTLCPEKILGWCLKPSNDEAEYINPEYLGLPVLGLMQGSNDTAIKEEIMSRKPDIILMMTEISEDTINSADEIQIKMNIPVVVADYSLKSIPNTYKFLGSILNKKDSSDKLGGYCKKVLEDAVTTASLIPESEKLKVYYAQGSKGLQTASKGSSHSEVIDMVGGENVVTLASQSDGRLSVNMEQVLEWNPDVVIASYSMEHQGKSNLDDSGIFSIITNASDTWKLVKAVNNNMVYTTPCYPYNWLDMPPSVNRIIGIEWMGNLLYPKYYDYDIREKTKEFYSLFYNYELSEEQLNNLFNNALRRDN